MGQYYRAVMKKELIKGARRKVFSLQNTEFRATNDYRLYNGLKLMEHSYFNNDFTIAFAKNLLTPTRVAWVGDYAEPTHLAEVNPSCTKKLNVKGVWGAIPIDVEVVKVEDNPLDKYNYLINLDKQAFIDLKKFKELNTDEDGYILSPFMLTAVGNGMGGGDYCGINEDKIGMWAWDTLQLCDDNCGFEELVIQFKEQY